jgi:hypothetical protein
VSERLAMGGVGVLVCVGGTVCRDQSRHTHRTSSQLLLLPLLILV